MNFVNNKYWNSDKETDRIARSKVHSNWEETKKRFKVGERILDIGCGNGDMLKELKAEGYEVTGITYLQEEFEECKKDDLNVILADVHEMPFDNETFDIIYCWDAFEHFIAPIVALGEMKRVLKKAGKTCIYIPGQQWLECSYHLFVPNTRQMKHLLKLADFKLIEIIQGETIARAMVTIGRDENGPKDKYTDDYFNGFASRMCNELLNFQTEYEGSATYVAEKQNN